MSGRATSVDLSAYTILDAIGEPDLFAPWFKDRRTWSRWFTFLRALFGLPMDDDDLVVWRNCTGRDKPPSAAFVEAWLVVGRRGGKSMILALIAVFLAVFRDWSRYMVPGERTVIVVIATDKKQAKAIFNYAKALLTLVPVLKPLVASTDREAIELTNGISIEINTASFRSVRGMTIVAALLDEMAFWRNEDTSANPDFEILNAIRPGMATVPEAMLLCASSPYARRGELFNAFRNHWGRADAPLVWRAPTWVMNPSVPQAFLDSERERDPVAFAAEYGAEFRSDLEAYVPEEVIRDCTVEDCRELLPVEGVAYRGFIDPAGGSGGDSYTLAISHREKDGTIVLDAIREAKGRFSPANVTNEYADLLIAYRCFKVRGDRWGGEFPREIMKKRGIAYEISEAPKSDIYRDTLPLLNSGKVRLLDHPRLANQFIGLERRVSRAGKDSIDHAPGYHDDIANAVAGALLLAASKAPPIRVGQGTIRRFSDPRLRTLFARRNPRAGAMQ
jgi:hypothetical protein